MSYAFGKWGSESPLSNGSSLLLLYSAESFFAGLLLPKIIPTTKTVRSESVTKEKCQG